MDKLEIRVLVESMYGDQSPTPGSSAAESRASMLGASVGKTIELEEGSLTESKVYKSLTDNLIKKTGGYKADSDTLLPHNKKGILRNKYQSSIIDPFSEERIFGDIKKGPLFEKGTWFQEHNIPKVAKSLAVAAARETIDVAVSIQKYQSSNAMKNHELDKTMKLANYGAAVGVAGLINPVAGAAVVAGIAISEIGSYIKQSSEYKYDQRLAGQNRETVRAASGNLSYGRPRGD